MNFEFDGNKMQIIGNRILGKRDNKEEEEKVSPGGIVMPRTAVKRDSVIEVVAASDDVGAFGAAKIEVGQKVVVGAYVGVDVILGGDDYVMVDVTDVLGVVYSGK